MFKKSIESNIPKLYILMALRWFMIFIPIIVLFFQENGLSMQDVLILQAVFSVGVIIFEVPSGYFSDIIGRRISIIFGCSLGFIGFVIYSLSYGFWGFLLAEFILGFAMSFISGADSALVYDSLLQLGQENEYKKIEGRLRSVGSFSEGLASILGGFLAVISLRLPLVAQTVIMFFSIPVAFSLVEPPRKKLDSSENQFLNILKIVKYSLNDHAEIKWLIIYSALVGASTLTMVWFIQPYLQMVGLPLALFGMFWATMQFSVSGFSLLAHKFEALLGRRTALISLVLLPVLGYGLLSAFPWLWAIVFIEIFFFVWGISTPILKDYINRIITSDIRATVLSVKNLIGRLIFALVGPVIGWATDTYSLPTALALAGVIYSVAGVVSLLFLWKHNALQPNGK